MTRIFSAALAPLHPSRDWLGSRLHGEIVRATAVGRGAERNAVLAGDPKGLVYYVMIV